MENIGYKEYILAQNRQPVRVISSCQPISDYNISYGHKGVCNLKLKQIPQSSLLNNVAVFNM